MARRAEWRRLPEETRGGAVLLRLCFRDLWNVPKVQAAAISLAVIGTLGVGIGLLAWMFPLLVSLYGKGGGFFAACVLVALGLGLLSLLAYRLDSRSKPPSGLLPSPAPPDTFLVHANVRHGGALLGADVAAAAFGDGWLHVEGCRASFSLSAADGRAEWRDGVLRVSFPDGQRLDLWLADVPASQPPSIERTLPRSGIDPWLGSLFVLRGQRAGFRHAANLWIADRERPEGESVLPPLALHPVARAGRTFVILAATLSASVGLVLILSGHRGGWGILGIAFLALAPSVRALASTRVRSLKTPSRRLTPRS